MKKITIALRIAILSLCTIAVKAQSTSGNMPDKKDSSSPAPTYMMPDGTFIQKDQLDSVNKSWNGALTFEHQEKDKAQGVLHVVRLSDAVMKQIADRNAYVDSVVKALVNKHAPDFNLTDMQGKKWSLSELRGKVVVLNFWYTSCPPCVEEMPQLNEITKLYSPDKVVFLALTFNDAQKVKAFLQKHEFSYTILPDSKPTDQLYNMTGWPTSLVIDKKGIITFAVNISPDIKQDLSAAINADL
jgi:peroxiredoxin